MKPYPLPALTIGLDVVSSETALPKGAVRQAHNIVIQNNGDFQRRPGHEGVIIPLPGAHSLWQSPAQTRVLVAAEDTLYEVDLANEAVAVAFVGLPFEAPVEYTDVGPDIYFTAGGVMRKIDPYGTVRRPGIINLLGERPTLTPTVGALPAGRYGVAYTLINDLGEESGASSIGWIDLTLGGILITGIPTAPNVARMNIYMTQRNGDRLYRQANLAYAASASILDDGLNNDIACDRMFLQPMPGGDSVRLFNGRLYTVSGPWVYCSRPLDYGVSHTVSDWMTFKRTVTMFEPVAGGIWVGLHDKTLFLRGNAPGDFQLIDAAGGHGALSTGIEVPADYFNPDMVPDRATPVVCWDTDKGMAIGRADGTLVYPQSGRVMMSAGPGRPAIMQQRGLKQIVFLHESLTMGADGAVDATI